MPSGAAALTGAFVNPDPVCLLSTGFVLDPAGNVVVSVYSSGAIGRLVPDDVIGLVRYLREHSPPRGRDGTGDGSMTDADIHFYFDPVCPFAWMTSKWVRMVAAQRDYTIDWRFISLRLINSGIDYDSHFPAGYEEGHTSGLRLLRVAARARAEHGRAAVGPFYETVSSEIFDAPGAADLESAIRGSRAFVEPLLAKAGLPAGLADALDDTRWDGEIQAEGDEALSLTGRDVGTPIIHFSPPAGTAFFGPVISRLPGPEDAVRLWDHVTALAGFPGFAELKRSLRERPQLRSFGVRPGAAGAEEDWHGGSRKTAS